MAGRALLPPRVLAVVAPVCLAGLVAALCAAVSFAQAAHSAQTIAGVAVLLLASTLAQRYPVPVDGLDTRGINLGFVFGVAGVVLFGWDGGVLVAAGSQTAAGVWERRGSRPGRVAFNASVFAIAAAVAGAVASPFGAVEVGGVAAAVAVCAIVQYAVNLLLVTAVVRADRGGRYGALVRANVRRTAIPFALMGATALTLVVLWQRTPLLLLALLGPLFAISLYQRSQHRALNAMRLALTDPLTGLGNHRHFHERLQRELSVAQEHELPLTLCLVDVDDFKKVNDRFGHPTGDRALEALAARLRQGGEAFRLGGDEFAILLPGHDRAAGHAVARSVVARVAGIELDGAHPVTVSVGMATFPSHGAARDELIRLADGALYRAKEHGKNRVVLAEPETAVPTELELLAAARDRAARFRAAASLARAVDRRDPHAGSHSERVARIAGLLAARLRLPPDEVELVRLAASLHDLGKLAIPEEILRKPGALSEPERVLLERHPQVGFRMLESLGLDPVAEWVLHQHERWDGGGYPNGRAGDEIPLGARILFVADAFDAMTSDRAYRRPRAHADAVRELERCAGTQFDPGVVAVFVRDVAPGLATGAAAALAS